MWIPVIGDAFKTKCYASFKKMVDSSLEFYLLKKTVICRGSFIK